MLDARREKKLPIYETWQTGDDVMDWWLRETKVTDENQIDIFEEDKP